MKTRNRRLAVTIASAAALAALAAASCSQRSHTARPAPGTVTAERESPPPAPSAAQTAAEPAGERHIGMTASTAPDASRRVLSVEGTVLIPSGDAASEREIVMTPAMGDAAAAFARGRQETLTGRPGRPVPVAPSGGAALRHERHATAGGGGLSPRLVPPAPPSPPSPVRMRATDELWVIQRPASPLDLPDDPDHPGSGALTSPQTDESGQTTLVPVPLKHTDVSAAIAGYIGAVEVKQTFENPYSGKIEAVYVFPLPENGAVSDFVMTVGDRTIRGVIRDRAEAERIYTDARNQGYVASLLTQERPNIFTQKVANIEPGKAIDIAITYYHTLAYMDGWYEWVFPMVVGPRFNPARADGSPDPSGIGAVPRGSVPYATGQAVQVPYLRPGERSGHDVAVRVELDAGVAIEEIASVTHAIEVEREGGGGGSGSRAVVRLAASDRVPNRDFVLRWRVAGDTVKSGIISSREDRPNGSAAEPDGYFTMMIVPPADLSNLERGPVEMVFVVDRSGSMRGRPIEQARAAVEHGLSRLGPGDSFQIIDFAEHVSTLGSRPLEVNSASIQRGLSYARVIDANGGTYMLPGLNAALTFPHDPSRLRFVAFLTDGYIGNESEILGALDENLGPARVFGFGVGSATNRYLIDAMSRMGRGAVAHLGLNDSPQEVMDLFFDRVSRPAMTHLEIDWGGARVTEVYPRRLPDLFVGRPVIITGRISGEWGGPVRVKGRAGGREVAMEVPVGEATWAQGTRATAVRNVWARAKIADLGERSIVASRRTAGEVVELAGDVRRIALQYGLMSPYTAFLAVDSSRRTEGSHGTTVAVPVPVPEGVRYETTVAPGPRAHAHEGPHGESPRRE